MIGVSTVTTKGQATVPESIRRYLGISVGDKLYFEVEPKMKAVLIRKVVKGGIDQVAGALKTDKKYVDLDKVREAMGEEIAAYYANKIS